MEERIDSHIKNRPSSWETIEAPSNISKSLDDNYQKFDTIILDCINLLSANAIMKFSEY